MIWYIDGLRSMRGQHGSRLASMRPALALGLDLVAQNQVGGQSEDHKEHTQDYEVHVELGVLHVEELQHLLGLLELTHHPRALQLRAVHPVDGQDDALESIPAPSKQPSIHRRQCGKSTRQSTLRKGSEFVVDR